MVATNIHQTSAPSDAPVSTMILTLLQKIDDRTLTKAERRHIRKSLKLADTQPSRHHRRPKACGGPDDKRNISIVPKHLHDRYHALFGLMGPNEIAKWLNDVWIDPDYELIVVRREP